jgi:L-threonylcarbamoyladenylate synthase
MGKETRIEIDLNRIQSDSMEWHRCREIFSDTIHSGGIAIVPSETSYMLAVDACNMAAVDRLRRIKSRPVEMQISVAFAGVESVRKWVIWNSTAERLARRFLPGALTMILPLKQDLNRLVCVTGNTLGIRVPGLRFLRDLLETVNVPVTATSANPHGGPEPYSLERCVVPVDLTIDAGALKPGPVSTVIDISGIRPEILREGAISALDISESLTN